jgi:type VI secretion system protein ImpM
VAEPGVIALTPFLSMTSAHRFSFHEDVDKQVIAAAMQGRSLWWTEGSPSVEASVLSCANMPGAQEFATMLNGS